MARVGIGWLAGPHRRRRRRVTRVGISRSSRRRMTRVGISRDAMARVLVRRIRRSVATGVGRRSTRGSTRRVTTARTRGGFRPVRRTAGYQRGGQQQ
jgi:hypothetical protein